MRNILTVVLALGIAGCAPSINSQMKVATDDLLALSRPKAATRPRRLPTTHALAVGQWIVQRTTDGKGNVAIQRVSVVGADAGGTWLEFDRQDYFHHNITKILYSHMPRTVDEAADVLLKVVTKTDNKPAQTIDFASTPMAGLFKSQFKAVAQNAVVSADMSQAAKENVTVPAGTFNGCAKVAVQVSVMGISQKSTSWFHPAVPINGSVKGASDDGKWTVELLDFGTSGASSKF